MFVLFKNIQGVNIIGQSKHYWTKNIIGQSKHYWTKQVEVNIIGQSKAMRLNTAETCTDSNGASEASTSEVIEHFI